jgi:hypothetical protein
MRIGLAAAVILAIAPAAAEEPAHGSLDFSRLTKPQEEYFWRRLKSLAIEEAALAHCGEADDFAARVKAGVRACVTPEALERTETAFKAEMKAAEASLSARKASCRGAPKPTRGWLGVELAPEAAEGAAVAGTLADSPAAAAGLKAGDVVATVNGEAIAGPKELSARIRALAPGAEARLGVKRDGALREVSVKLGAQAFDADGRVALDLPALLADSKQDLKRVADEVTELCAKCKTTIWALFCR